MAASATLQFRGGAPGGLQQAAADSSGLAASLGGTLEHAAPALVRPELHDVEQLLQLGRLDVCSAARHPAGGGCRDGCYTGLPLRLAGATVDCSSSDLTEAGDANNSGDEDNSDNDDIQWEEEEDESEEPEMAAEIEPQTRGPDPDLISEIDHDGKEADTMEEDTQEEEELQQEEVDVREAAQLVQQPLQAVQHEEDEADIWDSLNDCSGHTLTDASSTSSLSCGDADSVIFVAPRETFKCVEELVVAAQESLCLTSQPPPTHASSPAIATPSPPSSIPHQEPAREAPQQQVEDAPPPVDVRAASTDSGMSSSRESGGELSTSSDSPIPPTVTAVVAIDLGTTHSGYAYSVCREPGRQVHVMRRWEGGDSGLVNHKTSTALLLTPDGKFTAFGSAARDAYLDLPADEARRWLFFDRFKMELHRDCELHRDTPIPASNGAGSQPALAVFAHALRHLSSLALRELRERVGERCAPAPDTVRWVLTVPAMWRQPARQLVREAAYQAGLCDETSAARLLVVLEPEAAAVQCREQILAEMLPSNGKREPVRFLVADCGGGTVDITLHEMASGTAAKLSELLPAAGGPFGATGIDREFESLLDAALGADLMAQFRNKRPAAHAELMAAFEARKRGTAPSAGTRGVALHPPYAFVDFLRKNTGKDLEQLLRRNSSRQVRRVANLSWCREGGALRLHGETMLQLFHNTVSRVVHHVGEVLKSPVLTDRPAHFLFLVGGFSESAVLQTAVREAFAAQLQVVAPQPSSLATLRGAVLYGLDASVIAARRARHSYGVGVLTRFVPGLHPPGKLVVSRDGGRWCADVLDCLVRAGQTLAPGHAETRRYAAASAGQRSAVMHVYCAEAVSSEEKPLFVTDPGVTRCGTLTLSLEDDDIEEELTLDEDEEGRGSCGTSQRDSREVRTQLVCAGTELVVTATCATTGNSVKVHLDFLAAD